MVRSRTLQRLIAHVKASGAKLVLVGDVNRLQAIEAGGAFKALQEYSGTGHAALKKNVRQQTAEMRAVVAHTLRGEATEVLAILERKGMVDIREDWHEAAEAAVVRWLVRYDPSQPQESLLLAATNSAVDTLNDLARAHMAEKGLLERDRASTVTVRDRHGKSLGKREIAIGERLVFRQNRNHADITNNETGTVNKLAQGPHGEGLEPSAPEPKEEIIRPRTAIAYGRRP